MKIQILFGVSQPPQVPVWRSVPGRANGPGEGESLLALLWFPYHESGGSCHVGQGSTLVCLPPPALDNLEKVFKQMWALAFFVE